MSINTAELQQRHQLVVSSKANVEFLLRWKNNTASYEYCRI